MVVFVPRLVHLHRPGFVFVVLFRFRLDSLHGRRWTSLYIPIEVGIIPFISGGHWDTAEILLFGLKLSMLMTLLHEPGRLYCTGVGVPGRTVEVWLAFIA